MNLNENTLDLVRGVLAALVLVMAAVAIGFAWSVEPAVRPDVSQVWVIVALVLQYFFGTSIGSTKKQRQLEQLMHPAPGSAAAETHGAA